MTEEEELIKETPQIMYFDKHIPGEHIIDKLLYAGQLYIVVTGHQLFRRTKQKDVPVVRLEIILGKPTPSPQHKKLSDRILQHGRPV